MVVKLYDKIEKTISGIILFVLVIAGFAQVLLRYIFKVPLAWAEELIIFSSIWCVYLGSSTAAKEGKHIQVAMLLDHLPEKTRKIMDIISKLIWLVCSVMLTITGWNSAYSVILRGTKTVGGKFPYWIAMIAIPIGMGLMSIRVLIMIINSIRGKNEEALKDSMNNEEAKL